jgi:hypothetical protein
MRLLSIALPAVLVLATPALADHAVDNCQEIARASYRAADTAEALEEHAFRDAGRDRDLEDHRHETLLRLGQDARQLHLSLSNLYRSARSAFGGRVLEDATPFDHRGDTIREDFDRAQWDFRQLQRTYFDLSPYSIDRHIHNLYDEVDRTFTNLQWLVHGR